MATLYLARLGQDVVFIPYSVLSRVSFDPDDENGKAAGKDFNGLKGEIDDLAGTASAAMPDRASEIAAFRDRAEALIAKTEKPFKLVEPIPGVKHGRELKPQELDLAAQALNLTGEIDLGARGLVHDIRAFNQGLIAENMKAAETFAADSSRAVVYMVLSGLFGAIGAGAFSIWMATAKMSNPIGRMVERMKRLAGGDLDVEIEGERRKDEIGAMAAAVRVFKTNAIEARRLEAEAAEERRAREAERAAAEAARAEAAAEKAAAAERQAKQQAAVMAEREAAAAGQSQAFERISRAIASLADRDLSYRISEPLPEAFEPLRARLNAAIAQLAEAFGKVRDSAEAVHTGTQQIAVASDNLSKRTELQASNLEESAAALAELTGTIDKTAESAKEAAKFVASTRVEAEEGGKVVRRASDAMRQIEDSSKKIGEIIGVIDEIAFQTNLLALNAGVEAARAGESGRGFAVVASEVRSLAQRAADAAREIKSLISTSRGQVEQGVALVANSGAKLEQIAAKVLQIDGIVGRIASDAQSQASGIGEVNSAIRNMDQMTQQNAAMAEQATAAGQSLATEGKTLAQLIAGFNIGGANGPRLAREQPGVPPRAPASASLAAKKAPRQPGKLRVNERAAPVAADDDWREF